MAIMIINFLCMGIAKHAYTFLKNCPLLSILQPLWILSEF